MSNSGKRNSLVEWVPGKFPGSPVRHAIRSGPPTRRNICHCHLGSRSECNQIFFRRESRLLDIDWPLAPAEWRHPIRRVLLIIENSQLPLFCTQSGSIFTSPLISIAEFLYIDTHSSACPSSSYPTENIYLVINPDTQELLNIHLRFNWDQVLGLIDSTCESAPATLPLTLSSNPSPGAKGAIQSTAN